MQSIFKNEEARMKNVETLAFIPYSLFLILRQEAA
jgi:hypothetical protein